MSETKFRKLGDRNYREELRESWKDIPGDLEETVTVPISDDPLAQMLGPDFSSGCGVGGRRPPR
jgi:hypothetical protein